MTLRIASPVFSRIRVPTPDLDPAGRTLTAIMAGTSLPVPATRTAMRRIGRQRGPLSRRVAAKGGARSLETTWIARLNLNNAIAAPCPADDRAGARASIADGGRCRQCDLELRLRGCRREPAAAAGGGRRPAAARMGLPGALPQGGGRSPGARRASHQCVVHPAHHDERDGRYRPRADEPARGARESRARGDLEGRQRAAADGAGCDAGRHRDRHDGAVVPAADVRGAQGEVTGSPAARASTRCCPTPCSGSGPIARSSRPT